MQAYGHVTINVKMSGIDMLSASGHKLNGPKGIGFLYVNKDIDFPPFLHGGHQEGGTQSDLRRKEDSQVHLQTAKAVKLSHKYALTRERCISWLHRNNGIYRTGTEFLKYQFKDS